MASPIEATLILCDAAQADPLGKMHMLGAGWSVTSSPTAPSAVAVLLRIPWDRANEQLPVELALVDADGRDVSIDIDGTVIPFIGVQQSIEVGRPAGLKAGSTIDASFQFGVPPLPLNPGRYQWRLRVSDDEKAISFEVRGSPPQATILGGAPEA